MGILLLAGMDQYLPYLYGQQCQAVTGVAFRFLGRLSEIVSVHSEGMFLESEFRACAKKGR